MDDTEPLQQNEAVLLATSLVDYVAASAGLPVLFIKGPGATMMGLRENHISADVDVLVHPEQLDRIVGLLRARGWLERPSGASVVRQYSHSRTLYHPQWNSDIDMHDRFPGMEAPPGSTFDALWRDRQYLVMAARSVAVPSNPAAVIFQALGVNDRPDGQDTVSEEWRHRTSVHGTGTAYLVSLLESPWHTKPRVLARAIWPSRNTLRERNLHLDDSIAGLLRAHMARWRRGLAGLPAAARKSKASRRQESP